MVASVPQSTLLISFSVENASFSNTSPAPAKSYRLDQPCSGRFEDRVVAWSQFPGGLEIGAAPEQVVYQDLFSERSPFGPISYNNKEVPLQGTIRAQTVAQILNVPFPGYIKTGSVEGKSEIT